ncbi:hypothetical protein AWC05_24325 [Mycobacterium florentinum]|uniref:Uncharacterized protein n=1 Tax=Mycobacterium florentinum TaxID=292462 RepID=A0A1X1U732_MYCFL|nr:hypothetical protein [Mycobacterium florentinum]MCV7409727.1 hypothetical protein [Mycobacterium florentinum]ORV52607.1 hypothetical protein AWC05_24325 [Mycobacterium florentinum]BBX79025.1 hypothetical protein MFLOJ_28120 [Mycobacterium florentinum]
MRFLATLLLWLATTVALAVAVPAAWVQLNLVDENGYAALAQRAAGDPALQSAMAGELTNRTMTLIAAHGGGRYPVDGAQVHDAAAAYTAGPSFPPMFATANRAAHRWLFADAGSGDFWAIDVAPMLNDSAFQQILSEHNVQVPATLTVPLTTSVPHSLQQGALSRVAAWGRWASLGAVALCGVWALLMLLVARRRGKALTALGVSALLVGAAGWVGIEVGARHVDDALNRTTGDVRQIADVMVRSAEAGMRDWLNLTLAAGAGLVVFGVIVAVLGGLFKKKA